MLSRVVPKGSTGSFMNEYASLVGDAVLRHRTRAAEHAARIEADLANKVKSEFVANMSHELRTPLNTVMGFSKLLSEHDKRKLPDRDIVEYSQLIYDAASHLLAVINDILDISKMQSGKYTLDAREISLEEVLTSCVTTMHYMAEEVGVTISTKFAFDLPRVRGDVIKLRQAFSNLISNAIKFSKNGGVVSVEAAKSGEDDIVVSFTDTGIGMTDDEIRIALSPFGQVDGGRSRWREGTGLGLPIAKALVELHGGTISISSTKGSGTEVSVHLPPHDKVSVTEGRDAILGHGLTA